MFGINVKTENDTNRLRHAVEEAKPGVFSKAAFRIWKTATDSIQEATGPSQAGEPPHTHRGNLLKRAIAYAAGKAGAVIGTMFSIFGEAGMAHESGGVFRGQHFDARPFMGPALRANLGMFAQAWQNSLSA